MPEASLDRPLGQPHSRNRVLGAASIAERGLLPGRLRLSLDDAAFALSCGRTTLYLLVQQGKLIAVGKGRGRKITAESLRCYHEKEVAAVRRERAIPEPRGGRR